MHLLTLRRYILSNFYIVFLIRNQLLSFQSSQLNLNIYIAIKPRVDHVLESLVHLATQSRTQLLSHGLIICWRVSCIWQLSQAIKPRVNHMLESLVHLATQSRTQLLSLGLIMCWRVSCIWQISQGHKFVSLT